jgi:hypothetical protein
LILSLLTPFSTTRWGRTVAESHQPYVRDWFLQFGNFYFWLFIIGAIIFVYCTFTIMKKYRYAVTGSFVFFLAAFLQSRYSATPPFDGVSLVAKLLYFGSMIFVVCLLFFLYFYTYKKNPEVYAQLHNLKKEFLFVLIWFFVMLITARIAIRILLVFAPITAVLVSFLFVKAYDLSSLILHKALKILALVLIAYFLISPTSSVSLPSYYEKAVQTTSHTGPSYNQQWQVAMDWVKKNTPQDSVFAHWWDYGYWVQTGGERATLSDGGNSGGASLNYYTGRNVLTGRTNIEALEFLKVKGATHLLIISDEIGKYGAFSSIGSNLTYDRFSSIPVFNLDPSQTLEQRDETHILFRGGAVLEEDFTFEGQLFPKGSAGIGGIIVSYKTSENTSSLLQPRAVVVYKDAQVSVPLSCLFINGQEVIFPGEGLEACFQIIPSINDGEGNNLGAGFFLSRTVWDTLFAHMYLFNQEWEGFTLAYSDDSSIPLAQYNGRLAGPLKIWEISYPDYVMYKEVYESLSLPDPKLHYV